MTPEVEAFVFALMEKSMVGGAFLFLLYSFVNKFNVQLGNVAETLVKVCETLTSIDSRMGKLEERVDKIEGGVAK